MSAADNLAKAQAALEVWQARQFPGGGLDHGLLNLPLSKRGNIDAQLDQYNRLVRRVNYWRGKVAAQERRAARPARRQARESVHAQADLRARYGQCREVLWSLSGRWLQVVRWNAKSVTVSMGSARESIPHDQVAGAR